MAISWGSYDNRLAVGIDIDATSTSDASLTYRVRYYVRAKYAFADSQTMALSGSNGGSIDYFLDVPSSEGPHVRLIETRSYTVTRVYGGGPTHTFTAKVSGVFDGSTPSHSRTYTIPARPKTNPTAPRSLSVSAGNGTLSASWTAPSNTGGHTSISYTWAVSTSSSFGSTVKSGTQTSRSVSVSGLSAGTRYYFRVRANGAGSAASGYVSGSDVTNNVPSTPGAPSRGSITANSALISWSAPSNGGTALTSYQVQYASNSSFSGSTTVSTTSTSRTISSLARGTTYYVRVRAANAVGWGGWSGASNFKTLDVPSTVSTPTIGAYTDTTADLYWTAPANGGSAITSYQIEYASNSSFSGSTTTGRTATQGTITSLARGTTYYIRVRAGNAVGWGAWSGVRTVTTRDVPRNPGAPSVSGITVDSIIVAWSAPSDGDSPITSYDVRALSVDGSHQVVANGISVRTATLTTLRPGTRYNVTVAAKNAIGSSGWSAATTIETLTGAKIRVGTSWVDAKAFVRVGGVWVPAKVYKRSGGTWVV